MGKGGGEEEFLDYANFWDPSASWLDQTGTMHN